MQAETLESRRLQGKMARQALAREPEFQINRADYDEMANFLLETSYVYAEDAAYRVDLRDELPVADAVPECL